MPKWGKGRSLNRADTRKKPRVASRQALPGLQPFELVTKSLMKRQQKGHRAIRRQGTPLKRQRRLIPHSQ